MKFVSIAAVLIAFSSADLLLAKTIIEDDNFSSRFDFVHPDYPDSNVYLVSFLRDSQGDPNWPFVSDGFSSFIVGPSTSPGMATMLFFGGDGSEGSEWYVSEKDQSFSASSIEAGVQPFWGEFGEFFELDEIQVPIGESVFFGINTGTGFFGQPLRPARDIFGWVELVVDANYDVTMIDNAMAFGTGIVIGQNVVPEPSVNVFFLFVVAVAFCRARCFNLV